MPPQNRRQREERKPKIKANLLLGQRFLTSPDVIEAIVRAANLPQDAVVLEIGPGRGALTRELAKRARLVVAVEKDAALTRTLEAEFSEQGMANVRLIQGDILTIPWRDLSLPDRYVLVANIPYYLTGRLIRNVLALACPPEDMFLVIQREVAERITASPPDMNLLGLSVQLVAEPRILFTIPASAFSPRPKISSALIRITPKTPGARHPLAERILDLARIAFRGRRKMLSNTLSPVADGRESLAEKMREAGIRSNARPQELSIQNWSRMVARGIGKDYES